MMLPYLHINARKINTVMLGSDNIQSKKMFKFINYK